MALKPFHMLEGTIELTKVIKLYLWEEFVIERHYRDSNGDIAIVIKKGGDNK